MLGEKQVRETYGISLLLRSIIIVNEVITPCRDRPAFWMSSLFKYMVCDLWTVSLFLIFHSLFQCLNCLLQNGFKAIERIFCPKGVELKFCQGGKNYFSPSMVWFLPPSGHTFSFFFSLHIVKMVKSSGGNFPLPLRMLEKLIQGNFPLLPPPCSTPMFFFTFLTF